MECQRVRVVVTCTDGKTLPVRSPLRLRDHHDGADRAQRWVRALEETSSPAVPAFELYKGEHWSVARSLGAAGVEAGWEVELWVASAGYGLILATAALKPYAATFTNGQADSVMLSTAPRGFTTVALQSWWAQVASWPGPDPGSPRSLAELARARPGEPLVVVGSASYLRALTADAIEAAEALDDPRRLFVVSGGSDEPALASQRLPVDSRLLHELGGTRMSLNVRVAAHLVATAGQHEFDPTACRSRLDAMLADVPALPVYNRLPLSDEEVRAFIEDELERHPDQSATALLRRLRDSARACEQKRFGALYRDVVEGITA